MNPLFFEPPILEDGRDVTGARANRKKHMKTFTLIPRLRATPKTSPVVYLPLAIEGFRYLTAHEERLAAEALYRKTRARTRAQIAEIEASEREAIRRHERFLVTAKLIVMSRDPAERLRLIELLMNL